MTNKIKCRDCIRFINALPIPKCMYWKSTVYKPDRSRSCSGYLVATIPKRAKSLSGQ